MTLEQLEQELTAMLDPMDIPGDWTPRQRETYETQRCILTNRSREIRTHTATLAEVDPQIATLATWREHLNRWRPVLCDELLALDAKSRDPKVQGRKRALELSIIWIDKGLDFRNEMLPDNLPLDDLMRESGYSPRAEWYGTGPAVDRRLGELQQRRNDAQQRLDIALGEPAPVSA